MTNTIKFREDFARGQVVVYNDDVVAYRHSEYRASATWAQSVYELTDEQLMNIFRDYKEDYDKKK
jgi:hypothetical protein